ncbi:MAG: glycosyltransferase family 9 protein [Patescibacteria group bacterium]|jgi:ADP-heptose:LPS heptosyltransferase|nr:glycosyltransferase family 9 protein [Patescibacteria group bacterium]
MRENINNIFYISMGSIGETLMAIFFLNNISKNLNGISNTKFYLLVSKNVKEIKFLCKQYNFIRVIEINLHNYIFWLTIIKKLFKQNVVIIQSTFGKMPFRIKIFGKILSMSRHSMLIGYEDGSYINKYVYSKLLMFDPSICIYESLNTLLVELGYEVKEYLPNLNFLLSGRILDKYRLKKNKYIVIHPFAASWRRSLPPERWYDVINQIIDCVASMDYKIVLLGSYFDKENNKEFISGLDKNIINLIGLDIEESAEIIHDCLLFIGVDTGTTHLASVMQKNCVVIGNYSNPCWLPFYNKNAEILYNIEKCTCAPCNKKYYFEQCKKSYFICMLDLPDDLIVTKIKEKIIKIL